MAGSRVSRLAASGHRETWQDRGSIVLAGVNAPDRAPETGFRHRRAVTGQPPARPTREQRVEVADDPADWTRHAHDDAARSLARGLDWMTNALAIPCVEHGAAAGDYCWGSDRSGVRGVCRPRWDAGVDRAGLVR